MEVLFNTNTSEIVLLGDYINWDGYDRINNKYVYTTGLGFTMLNNAKSGYETFRSIPNL